MLPITMLAALSAAHAQLLTPFGLDESALARTLKLITAHRVDDADLYFQTTRAEGWSLEEGIVKSGSFSIDQGVGVRAVVGEKTAFAYSDTLSEAALADCAMTVRTIAAAGQSRRVKVQPRHASGLQLYGRDDPIASLDSTAKVALLEKVEQRARAKDPAVVQVMAGLAAEHELVLIARADGLLAADVRPLVRLSLTVIAERNGRREVGSSGGGGRFGLSLLQRRDHPGLCRPGGGGGADESGVAPGAGRRDDRGARPWLARRAAARGGRPWPGGRLQSQGQFDLRRPARPARGGQGRHRARRRHDP